MAVKIPTAFCSKRRLSSEDSENEPEKVIITDQSTNDDNFVADCAGRKNHAQNERECIAEITNPPQAGGPNRNPARFRLHKSVSIPLLMLTPPASNWNPGHRSSSLPQSLSC